MGSAQSARRIQPGGGPGRAGGPADLSRSPCLPTPPPALPPPLAALPVRLRAGGGRRRGGRGGGRAGPGVGPAGDRPPAGDRAPPGAFPPRRCAATGSGTAGKARRGRWLGGAPPPSRGGGGPALPGCYSPAGSSARRIPGPREPALVAALSPLPALPPPRGSHSREGASPAGGRAGVSSRGAGPPLPRRDRSPTPARLPPASRGRGWGRGGADCPQCAPGGSRRRARGVASRGEPQERRASARGPRRCRPPTRPVLKHGPRSLTRARVRGSHESRRGAMKVKAALSRRPRWDPEASPSPPRAHHRPVSPAAPGRWSTSARVRTRKMVNYAWAGRSQRKLWWRSVAVLTCKSVVRPGYRGERLIEPSSSWFPPKFPSG